MGAACTKDQSSEEFEAQPTIVPVPPPRATGRSLRSSFTPQRSIFRVGSRRINSPSRASNYNHVRDVVALNFLEADKSKNQSSATPLGVVGLVNLGNTCFLNSSLQCLSNTIPLTDYFLGYDFRSEINHSNPLGTQGKLVTQYAELVKTLWLGKHASVRPTAFKQQLERFRPQFAGHGQHDAQEFLSFLLDGIHEDLNRIKDKPYIEEPDLDGQNDEKDAINSWKNYLRRDKSLVVDIFQGQLRTSLECSKCRHKNIRFEPFMYLSLPISDTCKTIDDCLELYLAEERLTKDNQWYCSKCKKHRDALKKTDLWILPPILIVHLKRFRFNDFGQLGSKNNVPISYRIDNWDLSSVVSSRGTEMPRYDLYAVSNHIGGLGSGHYTAFCQNRFDDRWYEFNDSSCRRISPRQLGKSREAYLLFYNRSMSSGVGGGGDDANSEGRAPLIRRQSVSRPDLWPHLQVGAGEFRTFARKHSVSIDVHDLAESEGKNGSNESVEMRLQPSSEQESSFVM